MKKRKVMIAVFMAIVLIATYAFLKNQRKAGGFAGFKPVVSAELVVAKPMPVIATALGTLTAVHEVDVASEVNGLVSEIVFEDGQFVTKESLLIKLDDAVQRATLAQAQAQFNLANVDYERIKNLFDKGAISRQELDKNIAALKIAQADVEAAQARFTETEIRAPFDGRLDMRFISPGQYITSGQSLVHIVDKTLLKIRYAIPERYLNDLKVGMPVSFKTAAFPDKLFEGQVSFVSPRVDLTTRTITIEALLPNPDETLSSGLSGEVLQVLRQNPEAVRVPEEAILPTIAGYQVYVITDGRAQSRMVEIGSRSQGGVEVLKGLKPGEQVVTRGQQNLRDGVEVEIVADSSSKSES